MDTVILILIAASVLGIGIWQIAKLFKKKKPACCEDGKVRTKVWRD